MTTDWTCCRHFPCRGGWGIVVQITTDLSHSASAAPFFTSFDALAPEMQLHRFPSPHGHSLHSELLRSSRPVGVKESADFLPLSQRTTITRLLNQERSGVGQNSTQCSAEWEVVANPGPQYVMLLVFPEGAREWWNASTSEVVNTSGKVTSSPTRVYLQ